MDAAARYELNDIIYELSSIISELESISYGVRYDFKNIGNTQCSDCINRVINNYYTVLRKLKNMDTETVTTEFANANGGGGR